MAGSRSGRLVIALLAAVVLVGCVGGAEEPGPEPAASFRFELLQWRCDHSNVVTSERTIEADGEFCLVALDVRNGGDQAAALEPSCQFLVDSEAGRHPPDAEIMALDELAVEGFGKPVGPGEVVENSALYYDVPKGIRPAELELHERCSEPGVSVPLTAELET